MRFTILAQRAISAPDTIHLTWTKYIPPPMHMDTTRHLAADLKIPCKSRS